MGGTSYCSASEKRLHFGLASARVVDRIDIRWPSGQVETLRNVPVNQLRHVVEQSAVH
jgi:enediyne biosynthesis protein E4